MTDRVAIYARYSSDLQNERSIDDQVRQCREYAERQGWEVVEVLTDAAKSGATKNRAGFRALAEAVRSERVEIVLTEAIDRLSRDQEDTHHFLKLVDYHRVRLFTCDAGENDALQVSMRAIISAQYRVDLGHKTKRGLEGVVLEGRSAGGKSYGYDVKHELLPGGKVQRGMLAINPEQAEVVRRVFTEYAAGTPAKEIAKRLNRDGILSPRGKKWGVSTLIGNVDRGDGLLNNQLYIGKRIWGRRNWKRDPLTRNRNYRDASRSTWKTGLAPELRIIEDDLWSRVKQVQESTRKQCSGFLDKSGARRLRRPKFILSKLIKCASCGGDYISVGKDRWKCGNFAERGVCNNNRSVSRVELERRVFGGLQNELVTKPLLKEFIKGWNEELSRTTASESGHHARLEKDLVAVETSIKHVLSAVEQGKATDMLLDHLASLGAKKDRLEAELKDSRNEEVPKLKAKMIDLYMEKAKDIIGALMAMDEGVEAKAALRQLVDRVVVKPTQGRERVEVDLYGKLAGLFTLEKVNAGGAKVQVTHVAGRGFEPLTFRL